MKYLEEFRDHKLVKTIINKINKISTQKYNVMEVCGGQTHSIIKYGIDQLLDKYTNLIHGPGCPVCVTPIEMINYAIEIAKLPNTIFTSFGDMMRVPGSTKSLLTAKSEGADVRMVYSPLESIQIAKENPKKEIVFFGVGFETTAPANAMAIYQAHKNKINNFSALTSHVLVPPAIKTILSSPNNTIQGFLAAGHVCTIMGLEEYQPLTEKYKVPIVATGFEPMDIIEGILMIIQQLELKQYKIQNQYKRAVKPQGNIHAQKILNEIFQITDRQWRGIGTITKSGFKINKKYIQYDAKHKFQIQNINKEEDKNCISGLILQGIKKPNECPEFAKTCIPIKPLGATMVSSEGTCSAYYKYQRINI